MISSSKSHVSSLWIHCPWCICTSWSQVIQRLWCNAFWKRSGQSFSQYYTCQGLVARFYRDTELPSKHTQSQLACLYWFSMQQAGHLLSYLCRVALTRKPRHPKASISGNGSQSIPQHELYTIHLYQSLPWALGLSFRLCSKSPHSWTSHFSHRVLALWRILS